MELHASGDVAQATERFRAVLKAAPEDHPERGLMLRNLAAALQTSYQRTRDGDVLDEAISAARAAVEHTPADHPDRPGTLTDLAVVLLASFERHGHLADLEEASRVSRHALEATSEDHPDHAARTLSAALCLRDLFNHTGQPEQLDEAVALIRAAVAATPPGHRDRGTRLSELAIILRAQFERVGDITKLHEAAQAGRAAVATSEVGSSESATWSSNLATVLYRLAESTGDPEVLTEALVMTGAAADALPEGHPERAPKLSNLAAMARWSFERSGRIDMLVAAVRAGREAVECAADEDPGRGDYLNNLGTTLRVMYAQTGQEELLAEAVAVSHLSIEATPSGHRRDGMAVNLAESLLQLFQSTGRSAALIEALQAARHAQETVPGGSPSRSEALSVLGRILMTGYEQGGLEQALGESGRVLTEALEATPPGHPRRYSRLNDLAHAAVLLAKHTGIEDGYSVALSYMEEAQRLVPPDSADRPKIVGNYGALAFGFFERLRIRPIGEAAVAALRAAMAATPEDSPDHAQRLLNLSIALQELAEAEPASRDLLDEARSSFALAADSPSASLLVRARAAHRQSRLELATKADGAGLAAIERAIELLDRIAPSSLPRTDRTHRLALFADVPAQAAAAALTAGNPGRAVELLERSRGVLVAETLGLRSGELQRLHAAHPDLAQRLREDRATLAALDRDTEDPWTGDEPPATFASRPAEQLAEVRARVDTVLTEIRALPGFENFLRPGLAELTARAHAGPVVLLTCDPSRCDALIVTDDPAEPIRHVALPGLTHDAVLDYGRTLLGAGPTTVDRDLSPARRTGAEHTILRSLGWLWEVAVEPVLTALGFTGTPSGVEGSDAWPRIWWCPVGAAASLPLHAAGHHEDPADRPGGRRTVLDRVVSSYTPTLLALRPSDSEQKEEPADSPALIIAVPDAPGRPLPGAALEAAALEALLPWTRVLRNPTHSEALEVLPQHRIVHFACHGHVDLLRPGQSSLVLADHATAPLTVTDLVRLELDADLAYVSACRTGVTAAQLSDEALHLTGVLHLAGYRQVIGTLWPVDDLTAAELAADVYARLPLTITGGPDTTHAARALHHAVRALRDGHPSQPGLWAPYTHTGA